MCLIYVCSCFDVLCVWILVSVTVCDVRDQSPPPGQLLGPHGVWSGGDGVSRLLPPSLPHCKPAISTSPIPSYIPSPPFSSASLHPFYLCVLSSYHFSFLLGRARGCVTSHSLQMLNFIMNFWLMQSDRQADRLWIVSLVFLEWSEW